VLQIDSGTHQLNVFPLDRRGAGFRADYDVLLRGGDDWFRPVDVSIAPDGSVFVCDWYDAGVGGNRFSDRTTGEGNLVGPDLASIGIKYGAPELLYHVQYPSAAINFNFVSSAFLLDDGRVLTGLVLDRDGESIRLRTAANQLETTASPGIGGHFVAWPTCQDARGTRSEDRERRRMIERTRISQ